MNEIIQSLRDDHARMTAVLDALGLQIRQIENDGPIDPAELAEAVAYCLRYPAKLHHDKEDLLMRRLRARDAAAASAVGNLEAEHVRLTRLTKRFTDAANSLIAAPASPADAFVELTRDFISAYRTHIEVEDRYFLQAVLWSLTPEDWAEVAREIEAMPAAPPSTEDGSGAGEP